MTHKQHIDKDKLKASDAHLVSSQCLQSCLELDMEKRNYSAQDILDVLLVAATQATSIEAVCKDMPEAPSANPVRSVLDEALPEKRIQLEAKLNEVLVSRLPKKLLQKRLSCAIDITQVNYYGQDQDEEVRRGKPKDGTNRFHCYASLCVLKRHKRYTLALTLMLKDEPVIAERLLKRSEEIGLGIKRLLLDRGFDNNAVVHYLQEQSFASIMPLTLRGQRAKALLKTKKSYQTSFNRSSRDYGEASFTVYVACIKPWQVRQAWHPSVCLHRHRRPLHASSAGV